MKETTNKLEENKLYSTTKAPKTPNLEQLCEDFAKIMWKNIDPEASTFNFELDSSKPWMTEKYIKAAKEIINYV